MADYKLLVGLGNPGRKYADTRHNLGFLVLDYMADEEGRKFKNGKGRWKETRLCPSGRELWAVKPQTYMNLSGQAVAEFCGYYKIEPEQVLVVCDDINLPLGQLRIRDSGSAGGHNGLKDIISSLGSDRFGRIRLGINLPPEGVASEDFVLESFAKSEKKIVEEMIVNAARAVAKIIDEGITAAQNIFN